MLERPEGIGKKLTGQSSESQDKEVLLMEHFLLNILAAIVAGIVVALVVRRINR
jgi:hypothetical protein